MAQNPTVALRPEKKNILIIGASFAGVSTAHYLLKHVIPKLPSPSIYQIILIGPSAHAMCRQACPRALISDKFFDQDKLFVDIQKQFRQYPNEKLCFIHGFAASLDTVNR
jgi:NADH dehydrogenase FAD-containing subunit